jgi:hypothetical protein
MSFRKIIAVAGLILLALGLSGCLQLFGSSRGGGIGMKIELPKLMDDARSGSAHSAYPADR